MMTLFALVSGVATLAIVGAQNQNPSLATDNGNMNIRVPSGRSFSINCPGPSTGGIECVGDSVQVVNGECVPTVNQQLVDVENRVSALSSRVDNVVMNMTASQSAQPPMVIVVGVSTSADCAFGNCTVTVAAKPVNAPVALVKSAPIYRCRYSSSHLQSAVWSEYVASMDGYTVACDGPAGHYPAGVAAGTVQVSVDLYEGSNVVPWGHGVTGDLAVGSQSFIKNPGAPRVGVAPQITYSRLNLDQSNTAVIPVSIIDTDTPADAISVTLRTSLVATIQRVGNTDQWVLNISNVDDGTPNYSRDITIVAADNAGQRGNATVTVNFVSSTHTDELPMGSTLQVQSTTFNNRYDIYVRHYGNNINNFRPTSITQSITSLRANSKFLVQTQFVMATHGGSHSYVDIWRKIEDGEWTSLSRSLFGNKADGLVSEHHPGRVSGFYEQAKYPFVLDEPNVPAGTRIEYKVYVGGWNTGSITIGSHRISNNNGQSIEVIAVEEIANSPCMATAACIAYYSMPVGSIVQTVDTKVNLNHDVYVYHYNNDVNNFAPSGIFMTIVPQLNNSKIMIQSQFVTASHSGSHNYVDIWRSVDGGRPTSVSRALAGNSADGLMSEHPDSGSSGWYEQGKWPMVVDDPRAPAGSEIRYEIYVGNWGNSQITIGSHRQSNENGNSPEHMVLREIVNTAPSADDSAVTRRYLPEGTIVNTVNRMQNLNYDVQTPSYSNNINNFRPTQIQHVITTTLNNSKVFVRTQFNMAQHRGSHVYADIWRQADGGAPQSLSRLAHSNADGIVSEHHDGRTGAWYEQAKYPFFVDEPNVAAGTRLTYTVYVGSWSSNTITVGGHRSGNQNGNSPEQIVLQEIV